MTEFDPTESLWQRIVTDVDIDDTWLAHRDVVVVDLETTGTSSRHNNIVEVGAVKLRGGTVCAEFHTMVRLDTALPRKISQITGIAAADLKEAPRIAEVIASFDEFARGSVLAAHNASFDIGFLKAAYAQCDFAWSDNDVVCTLATARQLIDRGESGKYSLSALARRLDLTTTPNHRALYDARATAELLIHIVAQAARSSAYSLEDTLSYRRPTAASKKIVPLVDMKTIPTTAGVYFFRNEHGDVLYVGSAINLKRRVGSYFNGSDSRRKIGALLSAASSVDVAECHTELESRLREASLIYALKPPFNRIGKIESKTYLTVSLSRTEVDDDNIPQWYFSTTTSTAESKAPKLGPLKRRAATALSVHLNEACGVTNSLLPVHRPETMCEAYQAWTDLIDGSNDALISLMRQRTEQLASAHLFDQARESRDCTELLIGAVTKTQDLASLETLGRAIFAKPTPEPHLWEALCLSAGSFVLMATIDLRENPAHRIDTLFSSIPIDRRLVRRVHANPQFSTLTEREWSAIHRAETQIVARWIDSGHCRLVASDQPLSSPLRSAARHRGWQLLARSAKNESYEERQAHRTKR